MLHCKDLFFQRGTFSIESSFTLQEGDRLALTGPSGHGKTTLLFLLAGFLTPSKGTLSYKGDSLTTTPPEKRPFSFLFQENNLFDHLTVLQNMALAFHKRRPSKPQKEKIEALLETFHVQNLFKRYPYELSGGQRRRISFARCLLLQRPLLLLDEPFNGVDQETSTLLMHFLKESSQYTLVFTSHHDTEIRTLATQEHRLSQKAEGQSFGYQYPSQGSAVARDARSQLYKIGPLSLPKKGKSTALFEAPKKKF